MPQRPVRDYMTPLPHVIEADQPLAQAERRMRQLGVRHLPVVEQGDLVGVLSARDLGRAARGALDPETAPVEEAMTAEPYVVDPDVPLATVAQQMAAQRVGSAVVVEGDEVVGLFTSTDALVLLSDLLIGFFAPRLDALAPSEVAERLRGEQAVLRELLGRVDETIRRVEAGEEAVDQELTYLARELYTLRLRQIGRAHV
jgi:acetoin utilization protein AcuB